MFTKERALEDPPVSLSRRQKEVVGLLSEGKTSKEIAFLLDIDWRTVDFHVAAACSKLGVWSRRELMVWALKKAA